MHKRPKIFYGYWIVVATFFFAFINTGCVNFAFSLFVKPLQLDLGWSRGDIMAAFTIYHLCTGTAMPFVGRLADRYKKKKVISIGAIISGLGFVLLSFMDTLFHFYIGYAIIGIGMAAIGYVPGSAIVLNWFQKRRGLAVGIMSMGIGVGGLCMSPLIGGYLIPNFGWRYTYLILAIIILSVIISLAYLVLREKPSDSELSPNSMKAPKLFSATETLPSVPNSLTLKMAFASSAFWLITVAYTLSAFSTAGTVHSQVPYLGDIGFSAAMAAAILGNIGLMSAVGKFGFGWLCDRIPAKYVYSVGLSLQLTSMVMLLYTVRVGAFPLAMMWLIALTIGLGSGSWLPTMSILINKNFGPAAYGAIFGTTAFFQSIGYATGPLLAGYIYDTTNTYGMAFIIFLALYLISIFSVLTVRSPSQTQETKLGIGLR